MKKIIGIILISLLYWGSLFAQQARFTTSGSITFEKTVDMYAVIKSMMDLDGDSFGTQIFDEYKKNNPQLKKLKGVLTFADNKTLYTPLPPEEAQQTNSFFSNIPAASQTNLSYADYSKSAIVVQKSVFEEVFLLKDSLKKITWKITDETRDIVGYPCRRANGLVMDSIYAVAFYTEKIPVPGGPESFSGLPGMILGIALPHEKINWFATKITEDPVKVPEPPKKGKAVNNKQLYDTLKGVMKDWGKEGNLYLRMFLL